jgi:long-chain acyl-CoA synthetase
MHASIDAPRHPITYPGSPHAVSAGPAFPRWTLGPLAQGVRDGLQRTLVFPFQSRACHPFQVVGREHLESLSGPAIFIANHASHLDTPTVLRALPHPIRRRVAIAAAADYFYRDRRLGLAVSLAFNTFPLVRRGSAHASLAYCRELLEGGWSILIFPEGTRSTTGELQPFKNGVGLLATRLRAPVIPIGITGLDRVMPKGRRCPRPGPVSVRIGAPVALPSDLDPRAAAALLRATLVSVLEGANSA